MSRRRAASGRRESQEAEQWPTCNVPTSATPSDYVCKFRDDGNSETWDVRFHIDAATGGATMITVELVEAVDVHSIKGIGEISFIHKASWGNVSVATIALSNGSAIYSVNKNTGSKNEPKMTSSYSELAPVV